jgi:hypothetical protein
MLIFPKMLQGIASNWLGIRTSPTLRNCCTFLTNFAQWMHKKRHCEGEDGGQVAVANDNDGGAPMDSAAVENGTRTHLVHLLYWHGRDKSKK